MVQSALRELLGQRGFLASRRPFRIPPFGGSGRRDIGRELDTHLFEVMRGRPGEDEGRSAEELSYLPCPHNLILRGG